MRLGTNEQFAVKIIDVAKFTTSPGLSVDGKSGNAMLAIPIIRRVHTHARTPHTHHTQIFAVPCLLFERQFQHHHSTFRYMYKMKIFLLVFKMLSFFSQSNNDC